MKQRDSSRFVEPESRGGSSSRSATMFVETSSGRQATHIPRAVTAREKACGRPHIRTRPSAVPDGGADHEPVVPVLHTNIAGAAPGVGSPRQVPLLQDLDYQDQGTDRRSSTDSTLVRRVPAGATIRTTRQAPGPLQARP